MSVSADSYICNSLAIKISPDSSKPNIYSHRSDFINTRDGFIPNTDKHYFEDSRPSSVESSIYYEYVYCNCVSQTVDVDVDETINRFTSATPMSEYKVPTAESKGNDSGFILPLNEPYKKWVRSELFSMDNAGMF